MSKATLSVQGVDPASIECYTNRDGRQIVHACGYPIASLSADGEVAFYGNYSSCIRPTCQKVMNAAIDHWRATGRLFPELTVDCVCGGKAKACSSVDLPVAFVVCCGVSCNLRANTVAEWNIAMAAIKAAKGKS